MKQTRPYPDADELAQMYATPHDASAAAHQKRIELTLRFARRWLGHQEQITDLSCGAEAQIPRGLSSDKLQLGDLAPGYEFTGRIEDTVEEVEPGGLFVFSETLEHVAEPHRTLVLIRHRFDTLLLTTPWVDDDEEDRNPEHVWQWDPVDICEMLRQTAWVPVEFEVHDDRPYAYRWQFWIAER